MAPALEGNRLVGKGSCSDVYGWGGGHVLKLFHGGAARDRADREYAVTRTVHAAGLPVPAAYELVEVAGRWGIVFERVDGVSMLGYTQARPWALFAVIRQFAGLHARIHRREAPAGLRSLRERIAARIEASDSPEADKQAARDRLRRAARRDGALPRGLPPGERAAHPARPGGDRLGLRQPRRPDRRRRLDVLLDAYRGTAPVVARLRAPHVEVAAVRDAPLLPGALLPSPPRDATAGRGMAGTARGRRAILACPGDSDRGNAVGQPVDEVGAGHGPRT